MHDLSIFLFLKVIYLCFSADAMSHAAFGVVNWCEMEGLVQVNGVTTGKWLTTDDSVNHGGRGGDLSVM